MHRMLVATAAAVSAIAVLVPASARAGGLMQMPVYAAETFDPESPYSATAVGTNDAVLVFRALTLSGVKAKLDDGWDVFAHFRGENTGDIAGFTRIVRLFHAKYWPSADAPQKIVGQFNKRTYSSGWYVKTVVVEFTEGDGGVYARALGPAQTQTNTLPESFDAVSIDAETGAVLITSQSTNKSVVTDLASDGAHAHKYLITGVQLAKFVPSDEAVLAFENAALSDLEGAQFTASLGGWNSTYSSTKDNNYSAASHGFAMTGCNATTIGGGGVLVEMQCLKDSTLYCVPVLFTQSGDDVYAQALAALYTTGQSLGYQFANGDGTYNGTAYASVATNYNSHYLGVYGITARGTSYETADASAGAYITTSADTLVWEGLTLDTLKTIFDGGKHRIGAFFGGSAIGTHHNCEGGAYNPAYSYDDDSALTNICVQFQFKDGTTGIKSVIANFTETDGDIYARAVRAYGDTYASSYIGMDLGDRTDNSHTVATSSTSGSYGIHDLFIAPVARLDADEDWTSLGEVALGSTVVDLNGHSLTVAGLSCSGGHAAVINTANSTTATLAYDIPSGTSYTNSTVTIGVKTIYADNIKVEKTGGGTFVAARKMRAETKSGSSPAYFGYTGGTVVMEGTLKPGLTMLGNGVFGNCGAITVCTNATFDIDGKGSGQIYEVVLAGGTYANTVSIGISSGTEQYRMNAITLADDSYVQGDEHIGIYCTDKDTPGTLNLGGNTLTATIASDKVFYLYSNKPLQVQNGGVFDISGDGELRVVQNVCYATNGTTFKVGCRFSVQTNLHVSGYVATYAGSSGNLGSAALNVYDTFRPEGAAFYAPTMQPGSTLDVRGWTGAFPLATTSASGATEVAFNDDTAGVVYVLADAAQVSQGKTKLLSWDAKPENLTFRRSAAAESEYSVWAQSDGLYAGFSGMMIIFK